MTPKKLSDSEKQDIVSSYTEGGVTMASLARTFGVSASTISRVLRQTGKPKVTSKPSQTDQTPPESPIAADPPAEAPPAATSEVEEGEDAPPADPSDSSPPPAVKVKTRRTRRRSTPRATVAPEIPEATPPSDITDIGEPDGANANHDVNNPVPVEEGDGPVERSQRRVRRRRSSAGAPPIAADPVPEEPVVSGGEELEDGAGQVIEAIAPEDENVPSSLTDLEADLLDEEDSDSSLDEDYGDDEGYDEEEDEDEGYEEDEDAIEEVEADPAHPLEIFAFADVSLPNPCYLVVDRSAELITRPLKDFRDLGAVPDAEADHNTLPIFDNHRIARRFSARNQRVIKVPDSTIFQKTGSYLQAKKITRLLIDGRVYSL